MDDVGDGDCPDGAGEALRRPKPRMLVALDFRRSGAFAGVTQVAPHLPGNPQQKQPADQDQPDDLHQLGDHQREDDPQDQRGNDADDDDLSALLPADSPAASAPTTIALSPASTRSISRTWMKAEKAAGSVMLEKSLTIAFHISPSDPPNGGGPAAAMSSIIS
jgi:hypothetical protein